MGKVKIQKFHFPIFCVLLIIYSILRGLPNKWFLWAFIALILDIFINPIYTKVEEIEKCP